MGIDAVRMPDAAARSRRARIEWPHAYTRTTSSDRAGPGRVGEGADAQAPLARAVVGGLAGSTVITLVLIPVVYSLFHPDRRRRDA
jgi:hypothetical protein